MDALGVAYRAVAPEVDEDVPEGTTPQEAVAMLAERKARAVVLRFPEALVIGSDQLVSLSGRALGKPANAMEALSQLQALRGRAHEICTAVCLASAATSITEVDIARLTVFPLSDDELRAYIATDEWEGCAGGYRIEVRGQALFQAIDGDRAAIQGLPMQRVVRMLRAAGVPLF